MLTNSLLVAAVLASLSSQAKAIDFSTIIFDFRGNPIVDETKPGPRDPVTGNLTPPRFCFREEFEKNPSKCDALTLGVAAANSLLRGKDATDPSVEELKRRSLLAKNLAKGGVVKVTPEDIALIRKLAPSYYNPTVSGQIILEMESK